MPTQREHSSHNPELKDTTSRFRLRFLSHLGAVELCWYCVATRVIVYSLAVYGAYSLIT
jgi:hypothetical protein